MPAKKEIIYPIFLECCQYTTEPFWELIFEELAYGKAPSGSYISKDFLCCSIKGKEFVYKIERKDSEVLYSDVYELLNEKLGVSSQKGKATEKDAFAELEQTIRNSRSDWINIKKKNIKDAMYEQYVIDMKKKHFLSITQAKCLLSMILLSIMFKSITSKDIIYDYDTTNCNITNTEQDTVSLQKKIINIDGIEFVTGNELEDGKIIFKRKLASKCGKGTLQTETPNNMYDNWVKFVEGLVKKIDNVRTVSSTSSSVTIY